MHVQVKYSFRELDLLLINGQYIKYVGGGWRKVFVGAMKYFRYILMGHEIFFKIFDGPRNIFLCSIFIILFFKLKELKHKISKLALKEILKRHEINRIHSADIRKIVVKIKKMFDAF